MDNTVAWLVLNPTDNKFEVSIPQVKLLIDVQIHGGEIQMRINSAIDNKSLVSLGMPLIMKDSALKVEVLKEYIYFLEVSHPKHGETAVEHQMLQLKFQPNENCLFYDSFWMGDDGYWAKSEDADRYVDINEDLDDPSRLIDN